MLVGRCQLPADANGGRRRTSVSTPGQTGNRFFGNRLMESVIFSGAQRRVESQNFEGGKVEAVFGGIELDLSGAAITIAGPARDA